MRFLNNLSINRKLTVIITFTSGVALLLACLLFAVIEQRREQEVLIRDLKVTAEMAAENSASGLTFSDAASVEQTLRSLAADPHIVYAGVYDKMGAPFAEYDARSGKQVVKAPPVRPPGYQFTRDALTLFHEIRLDGETIGTICIRHDLGEFRALEVHYMIIVAALLLGCSAVALLIASRLQRVISGPIGNLARTAMTVATERDYAIRVNKESSDEVGRLIDGFNEMLAQIQQRDGELVAARDNLEKRVAERTSELSAEISERKRTEEQLAQQVKLATLGAEIGVALTRHEELRPMLNRCAESIVGHLGAAFARIWTLNHDENMLELQASAGMYTHVDGAHSRVPVGKFKIGLIAEERKPHLTNEVVGDPRVGDQEWAKREGMVAFAGYPLIVADQVEGVMAMFSRQPLADTTLRELGAIADGIALGIVRKRAEESALRGQERIRLILETAFDSIVTANTEGGVVEWNSQAERTFGWSRAEAVGRNLTELIIPERYRKSHVEGMRRFLATREGPILNKRLEIAALHKDGREIPVEVAVSPVRHGDAFLLNAFIRDITDRKDAEAELAATHRRLMDTSRQAGMAEVATGVLHNVGNVLNSVKLSATVIEDHVRRTKSGNLGRVASLLNENRGNLGAFITEHERGRQLPVYIDQLARHLAGEQETLLREVGHLKKNIDHIKDIVAMQQSYAKVSGVSEVVKVADLVDDALRMNAGALARHNIQVVREYDAHPVNATTEKHKVLQILVNLIRNAKYACDESCRADKQLTVRVVNGDDRVRISVSDNGVGIPPENLTRIFSHGFTTRKDGHGFGLHSGALAAQELGGALQVHSEGPGRGATFTLELPLRFPRVKDQV